MIHCKQAHAGVEARKEAASGLVPSCHGPGVAESSILEMQSPPLWSLIAHRKPSVSSLLK